MACTDLPYIFTVARPDSCIYRKCIDERKLLENRDFSGFKKVFDGIKTLKEKYKVDSFSGLGHFSLELQPCPCYELIPETAEKSIGTSEKQTKYCLKIKKKGYQG